jgi:hypothetical protein
MPKWIHERAKHISAKNPSMSESQAWAIATQQSHALGKSPKNYGTLEGRSTAKAKFDTPKDDKKTANPGHLESEKVAFTLRDAIISPVAGALVGAPIGYAVGDREHPVASALQGAGIGAAAGSLRMPTYWTVRRMYPSSLQMLKHPVVGGPILAGLGLAGAATLAKRKKTAGIAVQYDMDGNPKHAETSDDWLAAHFKSTGTFMVPNRLAASEVAFQQSKYAEVRSEAFLDELGRIALQEMMHKEALDPRLTRSLVGAGLGAGVGGATGYVGTKALEDLPIGEDATGSHAGRNAAIGALLGGVGGAGLGYLSGRGLHKLHQQVGAGSLSPGVPHDVPPIPLPKDIDPGMASAHEVHGAQQALEHIRASGAVPSPQALPGTDNPGDIYAAINRIQRLEPLTVRARAGANPGYLARKGIQARRGIATKFDLGPNETEMALRGKFGEAISPEEAEESLRRYQKLQDQRPTAGQIGRYATLGAVAAPIAGALKNVIVGGDASWSGAKKKALEGAEGMRRAGIHGRILAGTAAAGALTSGALPLVRTHLDQQAEKARLKEYLSQQLQQPHMPDGDGGELKTGGVGPESGFSKSEYSTPIEGPKRVRQASYIPPGHIKVAAGTLLDTLQSKRKEAGVGPEAGFSGTGYGNTGGYVDFHQVSSLNAPPTQSLQDKPFALPSGGRVGGGPVMIPTVKTAGPLGQLSASAKIGKTPAALAGNNSIASVAKPKGFGQVAVGAKQPVLH